MGRRDRRDDDPLVERLRRLAEQRSAGADPDGEPSLSGRSALRPEPARLIALRRPQCDPLTGHRGRLEGLQVAARAGPWVVELQVGHERGGAVLRGQVLREDGRPGPLPVGALVHLRTGSEVRLAAVDRRGEFEAVDLPDAELTSLDLELEDRVISVRWPAADAEDDR